MACGKLLLKDENELKTFLMNQVLPVIQEGLIDRALDRIALGFYGIPFLECCDYHRNEIVDIIVKAPGSPIVLLGTIVIHETPGFSCN